MADQSQDDSEARVRRVRQRTATLLAFAISPIALWLLYASITALQEAGSTGMPLGAPSGQIGILICGIGLFLIAQSARWTKAGLTPLVFWTASFVLISFLGEGAATRIGLRETLMLHSWSQLPVILLAITISASLALSQQRARLTSATPPASSNVPYIGVFVIAVMAAFTILTLTISVAPAISTHHFLLTRAQDSYGIPHGDEMFVGLLNLLCASLIPWLALRSQLAAQFAAWVMLIVPSFILVPLLMTLWELSPTPGNPTAMSWAQATPVTGSIGLVLSACCYAVTSIGKDEGESA